MIGGEWERKVRGGVGKVRRERESEGRERDEGRREEGKGLAG